MPETQTSRITVKCPCGAKLGLRPTAAGHHAKCPKCGQSFVVPTLGTPATGDAVPVTAAAPKITPVPPKPPTASKPKTPPASGVMFAACPCGKQIRVPATSVGKKARCPACAAIFVVSQAPAAPPPKPAEPELPELADEEAESEPFQGGSGIFGLADEASSLTAETAEQSPVGQRMCPNCGGTMPTNARLCVSCGYDLITGQVQQRTKIKVGGALGGALGAVGSAAGGLALGAGRFLLGTCLSMVGALIGAAIWAGIAIAADVELGIIAWVVGALAGTGMYLGYRDQNIKAGLVAAGISVVGIVAAKVLIVVFVIGAIVHAVTTGETNNVELQRAMITPQVAEECLKEKKLTPETASEKQKRMANTEAEARVKKMSDAQVREQWKKFQELQKKRESEAAALAKAKPPDQRVTDARPTGSSAEQEADEEAEETSGAGSDNEDAKETSGGGSLVGLFGSSMFGAMDILFFLLAVFTAFRIASGSLSRG
jgi:hypothetical protein